MASNPAYDTDDSAIPATIRRFLKNRLLELLGVSIFLCLILVGTALSTWSPDDPLLNQSSDGLSRNWLGYPGALAADDLMQFFGLAVLALIAVPMAWTVTLLGHNGIRRPIRSIAAWIGAVFCASAALSAVPAPSNWPLAAGLGGNAGDVLHGFFLLVLSIALKGVFPKLFAALVMSVLAVWLGFRAAGVGGAKAMENKGTALRFCKAAINGMLSILRHLYTAWREYRQQRKRNAAPTRNGDILTRLAPVRSGGRIEPVLSPRQSAIMVEEADNEETDSFDQADEDAVLAPRVKRQDRAVKPARKIKRASEPEDFELPPLTLLAEPKRLGKSAELSDEALEQNARMLEGVLDDFGVKGQIIKVRPGPVVTLYELEPAPGIKSSRVISLADDIARSMSAVSARVAVVSGRNAIGIELPNSRRETVYLRELLASEAFEKPGQNLALALGKNIGGEPIFADLARMPHLLIAGTTGSGKSVGINTMILSLLYRLPPDRCKLIMIDPKMLELSVYEGIPHLLSPVVTDPRKAIVALKWAVREMEERYRRMSKVGVRNIDGYNARMKQALAKGEAVHRTVQTGFDPASGEPIFERESMELSTLPYIVVIIDEMADLMMVAGKDIEGAVQRLAQMARAAGIHVIMATQRPSVDVITGTIKANFPTRISFQVTSKIDSRTILGEQGAEQLLGHGDMLYMAGGGRISRLHGPLVGEDEVEKIVNYLKSQGSPEYLEAVTEELELDSLPYLVVIVDEMADLMMVAGKDIEGAVQRLAQMARAA
ncbi:MAG TPA: DNA translocase FtsK, partial [Aestuariivirga sp.]|nr:DNA translocase FtsK [Aestuariivirga sp.]